MTPLYSFVLIVLISFVNGFPKWGISSKKPPPYRPSFCVTPPFSPTCIPLTSHWYYDSTVKACMPMGAGYCTNNFNTFVSQKKCLEMCDPRAKVMLQQCLKPPTITPCGAPQYAWYYDDSTKSCKMFTHQSCKSNGNYFASELKCQSVCLPKMTPKPLCSADPIRDMCLVKRKHFYFNFKLNKCMAFLKNGCGKGVNSFAFLTLCMDTCSYNKSTVACPNCAQKHPNELPPQGKPTVPNVVGPISPLSPLGPSTMLNPPVNQGTTGPAIPAGKPALPSTPTLQGKPSSANPSSPVLPTLPMQPIQPGKPLVPSTPTSQAKPSSSIPGTASTVIPNQSMHPSQPFPPGKPVPSSTPTQQGRPSSTFSGIPAPPTPMLPNKPVGPTSPLHPGNNPISPAAPPLLPTTPTPTGPALPAGRANQPKRAALPLRAGFHRK
ncbi:cleavage and polyadenylation specificity factor subunit 6 [Rhipicephalus sanguineus]|uniref:cleavage and polyadenylation specificity factor subunit 6 n=1 Tax=Rhipicephalus sanguineus TaxID=34632 RepID=UPI001894BE9D|nr:cleavage and polyadenylation specificity factor subunit 6 [Rhipicephalus sanguineus]